MAHFDFPYTCPRIDRAIRHAEATISSYLESVLSEVCPLLDERSIRNYAEANAKALYKDLEEYFEATRETNEDMRREAELQLKALQQEIDNLKAEVNA